MGFVAASQAAWTLIDDFDRYDTSGTELNGTSNTNLTGDVWLGVWDGTSGALITDDETAGDNSLAVRQASRWRGAETDLFSSFASDFSLPDGKTATHFFQVMGEGNATECMIGLSDSTVSPRTISRKAHLTERGVGLFTMKRVVCSPPV